MRGRRGKEKGKGGREGKRRVGIYLGVCMGKGEGRRIERKEIFVIRKERSK